MMVLSEKACSLLLVAAVICQLVAKASQAAKACGMGRGELDPESSRSETRRY